MSNACYAVAATAAAALIAACNVAAADSIAPADIIKPPLQDALPTQTPIKHLVIIFDENISFDHYFGTYPTATNPPGEPLFTALPNTPTVNNLVTANLLTNNPNATNSANGNGASNPFRLDRTQAATADQSHYYTAEQQAYDGGLADLFPKYTGHGTSGGSGAFGTTGQVMGYYDGNTVTALWNYAQHFAMSDNDHGETYGPSTPGALNASSGQTNGLTIVATTQQPYGPNSPVSDYYLNDGQGGYTMINDVDPAYDACSSQRDQVTMAGRTVGDLLNGGSITWGAFMGGFQLDTVNSNGTTGCNRSTYSTVVSQTVKDYVPHHAWFQYYVNTANPAHHRPSSVAAIGYSFQHDGKREPANHNYDLQDFCNTVIAGNFPSVSYIKMPAFADGHAGYSNPLDEQAATVTLLNFLQQQPEWKNTAVFLAWDDSDGWYDHAVAQVTSPSFDPNADQFDKAGQCGTGTARPGVGGQPVNGRCGPGARLPFLVISPWAKANFVGHERTSASSMIRFIEDNWLQGQRLGSGSFDAAAGTIWDPIKPESSMFDFSVAGGHTAPLFLDPTTGTALQAPPPLTKACALPTAHD